MPCVLVTSSERLDVKSLAKFPYVPVDDLASIVDDVNIHRVANFGVGTGRLDFQYPFVQPTLAAGKIFCNPVLCFSRGRGIAGWDTAVVFLLVHFHFLAPFFLEKPHGHIVNLLLRHALLCYNEKTRSEYQFVLQFITK